MSAETHTPTYTPEDEPVTVTPALATALATALCRKRRGASTDARVDVDGSCNSLPVILNTKNNKNVHVRVLPLAHTHARTQPSCVKNRHCTGTHHLSDELVQQKTRSMTLSGNFVLKKELNKIVYSEMAIMFVVREETK